MISYSFIWSCNEALKVADMLYTYRVGDSRIDVMFSHRSFEVIYHFPGAHCKVWDEITYPSLNLIDSTIEVYEG